MADRVCWQTCSDRTADPRNQFPGEPLLNQEFRLFTLLMLPPVLGLYGLPINLVHLPQVTPIFEVNGTRIRMRERPTLIMFLRPRDRLLQVRFQVNDGVLSALISQFQGDSPAKSRRA